MQICELTIVNSLGLHARAAAKFVHTAGAFNAHIRVARGDREVDGKSIMGLMMLAAGHGAKLIVTAEGTDAEEAVMELGLLIQNGFEDQDQ